MEYVTIDGFFLINIALVVGCLVLLLSCFPKCHRRYKFVFVTATFPLLYILGMYIYELVTGILPDIQYRRSMVTSLLILLGIFIALTHSGNGYHERR